MRLPSAPCSSWPRIETGTSARSSSPSVRTPRVRSQRPSAPATTASTASFTVPPSASLISLKSLSRLCTQRTRRCGPIGTLSGTSGAGLSPAQTISPTPSAASRACSSERPGLPTAPSARPASATGVRTSPLIALGDEVDVRRLRRRRPAVLLGDLGRDRLEVEQHGGDVHARHAVHERVVGLRDHRELAALEALDRARPPRAASSGRGAGRRCARRAGAAGRRSPASAARCGARGSRC